MKKYDAIIIGAGQAGPSLAATMVSKGEKVAIVERKLFGGTCVNNGCTPTKTLIASAKAIHTARRGHDYGFLVNGTIDVDMKKVKMRKDRIVERSAMGLESWINSLSDLDVYEEHATFLGNHVVQVGKEQLSAPKIFINVGTRARIQEEVNDVNYFTNSSMMDVDFVPEHLIILGGSYVGLEFAQMYRRFGSKVTVVEKNSRLLHREDVDVSLEVKKILENERINFRLGAECIKATQIDSSIKLDLICENGEPWVRGSHLLVATGRLPNTHDLGLENTQISIDDKNYIQVDEFLRTTVDGVWALGDVNGQGAFTHTAYNDFEIVADQLYGEDNRSTKQRIPCYALYTDPPLARIGLTENEALKQGRKLLKGDRPFSKIARARENGEEQGFMKVIVDSHTEEILGATILGVNGDEVIHGMLDLMYARASYKTILNAIHIHPTVSELIPTMLSELKSLN